MFILDATQRYHALEELEKQGYTIPEIPYIEIVMDVMSRFQAGIIADFFLGSGTTLIAAEQLNRICYGMEIEPRYVDVILERYATLTGDDPIRERVGKKWSELKTI